MKLHKSSNKTSDDTELSTKVKDTRLDRLQKQAERVNRATAIIDELRSSERQNKVRQLEHKASRAARTRKHQLLGEAVDRLLDLGAIDGDKIIQELDSRLISSIDRQLISSIDRQLFNLSPRYRNR